MTLCVEYESAHLDGVWDAVHDHHTSLLQTVKTNLDQFGFFLTRQQDSTGFTSFSCC